MFFNQATQAMLDKQAELGKTQLQVATGKRILTPSDDPSGSARILDLTKVIETHQQYQENIDMLRSRLDLQDTVLASATNVLQRAYELSIQGNNDVYAPEDRAAIAAEVDELLGQMLDLANTRDANGEYLFAGFQRDTQTFVDSGSGVFAYQGDQGHRMLQISPTRQVADSDNGFEIFMDVPASALSGGGTREIFSSLYELSQGLRSGSDLSPSIADLQLAMERVTEMRARAGARLNTAEDQEQINASFILSMQTQLSEVQDLDYAEAVSRLNLQATALQAAQQSFAKLQGLSLFNFIR
jgi:flagellar hook-associated protein 3 FlgL